MPLTLEDTALRAKAKKLVELAAVKVVLAKVDVPTTTRADPDPLLVMRTLVAVDEVELRLILSTLPLVVAEYMSKTLVGVTVPTPMLPPAVNLMRSVPLEMMGTSKPVSVPSFCVAV